VTRKSLMVIQTGIFDERMELLKWIIHPFLFELKKAVPKAT
jgi:hypothetical protein